MFVNINFFHFHVKWQSKDKPILLMYQEKLDWLTNLGKARDAFIAILY